MTPANISDPIPPITPPRTAGRLSFLLPFEGLKETWRRFPVSTMLSLLLFVIVVLCIHKIINLHDEGDVIGRIIIWLACGFFWFGLVDLLAESRKWRGFRKLMTALPAFVVLLVTIVVLWGGGLLFFTQCMIVALLLGIGLAPYLSSSDNLSFWFFNYRVSMGASVAMLAGLFWGGGISAALLAIRYLFDIPIDGKIYGDLWALTTVVFIPLYALSWVPKQFSFRDEDCHAPPQLNFIVHWVWVPLSLVYLLILYAYLFKILLIHEIPRGQLSYMVAGFGAVGVATYLSGWPLRNESGAARFFFKIFFPALLVPTAMQFTAIGLRIWQYGITEDRYTVVLIALWFAIISVAFTLGKIRNAQPPLNIIPAVLVALVLVASAGPWGASMVSAESQQWRLGQLLMKDGILQNGVIVKPEKEVPFEDKKNITSILDYLQRTKKISMVNKWMERDLKSPINTDEIVKHMGFERVSSYAKLGDDHNFSLSVDFKRTEPLDVRGFDYILSSEKSTRPPQQFGPERPRQPGQTAKLSWLWDAQPDMGLPRIEARLSNSTLAIAIGGSDVYYFKLTEVLKEKLKSGDLHHQEEIVLDADTPEGRLRLYIINVRGIMNIDVPIVQSLAFRLLLKLKTP